MRVGAGETRSRSASSSKAGTGRSSRAAPHHADEGERCASTTRFTARRRSSCPARPGKVSIYVCGPTVYNHIHIGNARTFLSFDVIRRYLEWKGYDVRYVQNITDVDDKIINRANEEGRPAGEVAAEYTAAFVDAMRRLGVEDPTVRPKATETIPQMIGMIERLIERGHAYVVDGDVYFSVRSFPGYGKLSGSDIDEMHSGARSRSTSARTTRSTSRCGSRANRASRTGRARGATDVRAGTSSVR